MLDEEWLQFLNTDSCEPVTNTNSKKNASIATTDFLLPKDVLLPSDVLLPNDLLLPSDLLPTYIISPLCISTKTTIAYLNQLISLSDMFWKLKLIHYSDNREGIIKKQMKFNSHTVEEYSRLIELVQQEKSKGFRVQEDVISAINTESGRVKFKDIRKLSVGFSSKDCTNKPRKKSAFYNCFVIIVRVQIEDKGFKEYHVKIFNTGKLEIPGLQTNQECEHLLFKLIGLLKEYEPEITLSDRPFDTILINSNFKTGFYLNRDNLYDILQHEYKFQCVYDPCSYPGIQCKFYYYKGRIVQTGIQDYDDIKGKGYGYKKKNRSQELNEEINELIPSKMDNRKNSKYYEISIMIFRTGSILLVGMCPEEVLNDVYDVIRKIMEKEYSRIKQTLQDLEPIISKQKKRKKTLVLIDH